MSHGDRDDRQEAAEPRPEEVTQFSLIVIVCKFVVVHENWRVEHEGELVGFSDKFVTSVLSCDALNSCVFLHSASKQGVCCSVLQCVAVCCGVLQFVAVCCSVLQCAAVC